MQTKVIRTEEQYHTYLDEVAELMSRGELGRSDVERLELLTVLIESYENTKYPIELPDPIDAILFRMEERGLKQADLIPYLGTSGRVSEILNRKRPLTVQMIRALSVGLGLSAETLVGLAGSRDTAVKGIDWSQFPVKEMVSRGWIAQVAKSGSDVEGIVRGYISGAGLQLGTANFRRSLWGEANAPTNTYALYAWLARVIQRARMKTLGRFDRERLSLPFLRDIAQMSWSRRGPQLAIEYLEQNGIAVIAEPQLKGTQLDGAALIDLVAGPVIGLTLRFDRLDSFWFTLLHELVHIWKHLEDTKEAVVDDLNAASEDKREAEANRIASEAIIPRLVWKRSEAYLTSTRESVEGLARQLRVHPALVVGRLHRDTGNYTLFNDLLGRGEVKVALLNAGKGADDSD